MQLGMIGLGRMGANMVRRLLKGGHHCIVYDRDQEPIRRLIADGATGAGSPRELVSGLSPPRVAWLMLPAGTPTDETVSVLGRMLDAGDIIVDGGNTHFKDDVRRAEALREKGVHYVDVGTSGGIRGLERGYCLMVGGDAEPVRILEPILATLAPGRGEIARTPGREQAPSTAEEGYLHCGPVGAGHFVKMVHNGIEYGLMQAYAEGFHLLRGVASEELPEHYRYALKVADIAELWRRGSVVGSWLLDLAAKALLEDPNLERYSGFVHDSGEGRWVIEAAIEAAVPVNVQAASLFARFRSRQEQTFAEQLLSAMRHEFGGHVERPSGG